MGWKYIALLGFLKAQELSKPKANGYQTALIICILSSCISIPTRKKYHRKNSSQHIQSSSGSSSYMRCKIYKKILLVFQSPLLYVTDTITRRPCSIPYTAYTLCSIWEDNTHSQQYRNALCVTQILINKDIQSQRSCAFLHCWHFKASSN